MKLAVVSDLHYSRIKNKFCPERAGEKAAELLQALVEKLNCSVKPDVLLVGGDLVNVPGDLTLLAELAGILQTLDCPWIAIPGNHDPEPEQFYSILPPAPDYMDVGGIRILPFPDDLQTAGYNAHRTEAGLDRLRKFSHDRPTVLFQHVPLYRSGTLSCPYSYDNAEEIFMASGNVAAAVSGHHHPGCQPVFAQPFPAIVVPALCEGVFPFALMDIRQDGTLENYETIRCTI